MPSDKYSAHFRTQSTSGSPASYPAPQWKTELKDQSWPWGVTKPKSPHCTLQFTVPNDLAAPVLLYYRLTNFYQNHRRYVKSFDDDQLAGKAVPNATIQTSPCDPLRLSSEGKAYYPCGLIANSVFNDTFDSPVMMMGSGSSSSSSSNTTTIYPMTANDIAWPSDQALFKKTSYTADQIAPPPNWHERYPQGYTPANLPDLSQLQSLQVWMRTAGLPTFSKLALRNDDPSTPMRAGTYRLAIFDNFPATKYGGTKSVVLSTRTVMGGRNAFLGIAYVVVGALLLCLGVLFTLAHLVRPRKLGDHSYLTWSQERVGGGAGAGAGTGTGAGSGGENGATTTTGAQR